MIVPYTERVSLSIKSPIYSITPLLSIVTRRWCPLESLRGRRKPGNGRERECQWCALRRSRVQYWCSMRGECARRCSTSARARACFRLSSKTVEHNRDTIRGLILRHGERTRIRVLRYPKLRIHTRIQGLRRRVSSSVTRKREESIFICEAAGQQLIYREVTRARESAGERTGVSGWQ